MRSDQMKVGIEKAPHRSLFQADGLTEKEIQQPMVGIVNSFNEIIPGHIHLRSIAEAVKAGVRLAGGTSPSHTDNFRQWRPDASWTLSWGTCDTSIHF